MGMKNKLFKVKSYIPDFLFNYDIENIKNQKNVGLAHLLAYLILFIIQIPLLILTIKEMKSLKKEKPLISKNEKNTGLSLAKKTPETRLPSDFN